MFDDDVMNHKPRYATKIYLASSWKNETQTRLVRYLKASDYVVYDFKNPPNKSAFSWKEVDPNYERGKKISADEYRRLLASPEALRGYRSDMDALKSCDVCLLVLPAGRSAAWEYGWAVAQNKHCGVIWFQDDEPDLMFKGTTIIANLEELDTFLQRVSYVHERGGARIEEDKS